MRAVRRDSLGPAGGAVTATATLATIALTLATGLAGAQSQPPPDPQPNPAQLKSTQNPLVQEGTRLRARRRRSEGSAQSVIALLCSRAGGRYRRHDQPGMDVRQRARRSAQ